MNIKWGILGAGSVAQRRVMPAMNALENHTIAALMVRDMNRAQTLAEEYNAGMAYDSADALIADENVNAVYVSSPVNFHCEHVLKVAAAGKHVLCEKPMGMTSRECLQMMDACERAGVHLQICFVMRGWPIYHKIRQQIADGVLGQVVELRSHMARWLPFEDSAWRIDPAIGGGGVLIDVGAHVLDLFRFLIGDFDRIGCMTSSDVFNWRVEESAFVSVRFKNGTHGVIGLSFAIPQNGNVLEIYGKKGSLFLGKELRLVTADSEDVEPAEFPDYYSALLTNFHACITDNAEPLAPGIDGLRNMEAIEAAYLAKNEERVIKLEALC